MITNIMPIINTRYVNSGDFLPGYVTTLANPTLDKIKENIIVIGFEDGKIYFCCNTKQELMDRISKRKNRMKMLIYYKTSDFSQEELNKFCSMNLVVMNTDNKDNVVFGYNQMMKIVYM